MVKMHHIHWKFIISKVKIPCVLIDLARLLAMVPKFEIHGTTGQMIADTVKVRWDWFC